jgi:hypothetical protein
LNYVASARQLARGLGDELASELAILAPRCQAGCQLASISI